MPFHPDQLLLYAVTDRAWTGRQTLLEQLEAALQGGVTLVQLREKDLDPAAFLAEALEVKALCHRYHVPLILNDQVDLAPSALRQRSWGASAPRSPSPRWPSAASAQATWPS